MRLISLDEVRRSISKYIEDCEKEKEYKLAENLRNLDDKIGDIPVIVIPDEIFAQHKEKGKCCSCKCGNVF